MSLFGILNTATAALLNTQTQIGTVSDNIGNSNSTNYTARQATVIESDPAAGGTDRVVINRTINASLQQEFLSLSTGSANASVINNIYTQLEQLDGSSTGTPSLVSAMQQFTAAFQALQATPESTTAQQGVINAGQGLVQTVQTISTGVEAIATQTQQQTQTDVGTLNTTLASIATLNQQIGQTKGAGVSTAALQDTLDAALQTVSTLVPVKATFNDNGTVQLATPDGVELVGATANSFAYNAATNTIFSTNDPNATSLNASFATGTIGAEISTLDTSAAGVASQSPAQAPLEKIREQLNSFVDQFWAPNPPGPMTAFQAAYNNAVPSNAGEQATDFFTISGFGAAPSTDRFGFQVNPALLNGTATVKQAAASPVTQQLLAATNNFNAGGVSVANQSYTGIAAALASNQTQRAQGAQSTQQSTAAALTTTQTTYKNATGVNVDQELSQLIVLQNTYGASAKVISVVEQLFSSLQTAVGAA